MNKQELERGSAEIYALMRDTHLNAAKHMDTLLAMLKNPLFPRTRIVTAVKEATAVYREQADIYDKKASVASQEAQHAAKANQQGVESGD